MGEQPAPKPPEFAGTITDIDSALLGAAPVHLRMFEEQLASDAPHETEFNAFKLFANKNCIVFDIGANIGNSALSLHLVQPTWRVISFEPNVALSGYHDRVAQIFERDGSVFQVFRVGLGSEPGELAFYVPRIDNWHVVGEASFDLDHFCDPIVTRRLSSYSNSGEWQLSRTRFPVVRFDDFSPVRVVLNELDGTQGIFVKMDVEGFEESALSGMREFIKDYRPILMIENTPTDGVPAFLAELDYKMYGYEAGIDRLVSIESRRGYLNSFYLHEDLVKSGQISSALGI